MRLRAGSIILMIVGLGAILAFVYYLHDNWDAYSKLLQISLIPVVLLLTATSLSSFLNGLITVYLFRGLGIGLQVREGFFLSSASTLANQLPVSGGMITRALYLKHKHGLSYATFITTSLALYFCFVSANGFIGVLTLIYLDLFTQSNIPVLLMLGFIMMSCCILLFKIPIERIPEPGRLQHRLVQILEGWRILGKQPGMLGRILILQMLMMLLLAFRYWLAFQMLSQDISVAHALLFSSASVLTQLVSIAPGGLGVTEVIVAGVATLLGFDTGVSVVAVGLDRLISTSIIVLIGGISVMALNFRSSEARNSEL